MYDPTLLGPVIRDRQEFLRREMAGCRRRFGTSLFSRPFAGDMTTTTFVPMPFRCRLGVHAWQDVACPDGHYLRTCTRCHDQQGPFARFERHGPPRDDPRCYPVAG